MSSSEHPEAERRLRRALTVLRGEGIEAHGQVAHPDPFTAAAQAVQDERIDEIIVSTFPGEKTSSWLRGDLVNRLRKQTGLPVEHVEVAARAGAGGAMSAHAEAHAAHPPQAHQSSRVDARTLGMFLFIASEIMLFGSFFTAYFFVRVAAGTPWPPRVSTSRCSSPGSTRASS